MIQILNSEFCKVLEKNPKKFTFYKAKHGRPAICNYKD